jgi:hypothetical protein
LVARKSAAEGKPPVNPELPRIGVAIADARAGRGRAGKLGVDAKVVVEEGGDTGSSVGSRHIGDTNFVGQLSAIEQGAQ